MAKCGRKNSTSGASSKANEGIRVSELVSITDTLVEKQLEFFEPQFAQPHEMDKCTEHTLDAIQTELASLSGSIGLIKAGVLSLKHIVEDNSKSVANHPAKLQALDLKMADMEDKSRRYNIRVLGLKEGSEGSNAVQYLTRSLPKWLPSLQTEQLEIMWAHWIYSGCAAGARPRTLIFNTLQCMTRQAILCAARKDPVIVESKKSNQIKSNQTLFI